MSFYDDLALASDDLFAVGGLAATYNGVAVTVLPQTGVDLVAGREVVGDNAEFLVRSSEVAQPAYRDLVVLVGVTWTVQSFRQMAQSMWLLVCHNNQRPVPVKR